jgi:hypothetical protein
MAIGFCGTVLLDKPTLLVWNPNIPKSSVSQKGLKFDSLNICLNIVWFTYGHIWAYLGIFGHIWVYLGIFGHKLLCLGRTISHWESIACPMSDSFRFCLNHRPWRPGWSFKHVWNLLGVLICFQKNDIRLINGGIRSLELGFTLWQFNIAMENGHL